jgi:hypothetical protein
MKNVSHIHLPIGSIAWQHVIQPSHTTPPVSKVVQFRLFYYKYKNIGDTLKLLNFIYCYSNEKI